MASDMMEQNLWMLKTKPYEVQMKATLKGWDKENFAYYMEMGLGKSGTLINDFMVSVIHNDIECMVVIGPNSLKLNWKKELQLHGLDDRINCFEWPNSPKKKQTSPFILSINPEAVRQIKTEEYVESLMKEYKSCLAVDESILMANRQADQSKSILRLRKFAARRRLLSGLPMSNGPQDIWTQLIFLDAIKMDFYPFRQTFCQLGGFKGKQIMGVKESEVWRLNQIIGSVSFRATKQEYLDIPAKVYPPPRQITMSKLQKEHYMDLEKDLFTYIEEYGEEVSPSNVLVKLGKLRQILSGFVITDSGKLVRLEKSNSRVDEIVSMMNQVNKMVIVCFHTETINHLEDALSKFNPVKIVGKQHISPEELEENKNKFNNYKDVRPCLVQISSGQYGHTLIGSEKAGYCTNMAFMENSFSLNERIQVEDRIHRIGQQKEVSCTYHDFVSAPLDMAYVSSLQRKTDIVMPILDLVKKT